MITVGRASAVVAAGNTHVIKIPLNGTGQHLLAARVTLPASIVVTQTEGATTIIVSPHRLALKAHSARREKTH